MGCAGFGFATLPLFVHRGSQIAKTLTSFRVLPFGRPRHSDAEGGGIHALSGVARLAAPASVSLRSLPGLPFGLHLR